MHTIGGRIKRLREDRKLSLENAAEAARIPIKTWREFEDGLRHPTGVQMVKLAHLFEVTVTSLTVSDILPPPARPKMRTGLEACYFCGVQYHPMTRWSLGGDTITVCDPGMAKFFGEEDQGCQDKARAAGFEPRPDLTPRR